MGRRRAKRPPELTPLIDVLFILLFATLIQARSAVHRAESSEAPEATQEIESADAGADAQDAGAAGPVDAGPIDAGPIDAGVADAATGPAGEPMHLMESRELAETVAQGVFGRSAFVVEIHEDGYVTAIARWRDGREIQRARLRHRLLRPVQSGEAGYGLVYIENLCSLVRAYAEPLMHSPANPEPESLSELLILVILDVPLADTPLALTRGLQRDFNTCFDTTRGMALLLQPGGESLEFPRPSTR